MGWFGKSEKRALTIGNEIKVVHAGLVGLEEITWTIGKDIDLETVLDLYDYKRDCLYAMTHFEKGEEIVTALSKKGWDMLMKRMKGLF